MYGGYNKVFQGMFITSFNISLGPINLLPNFVGFLLISGGLNSLYKESSLDIFHNRKTMGTILTLMSFMGGVIELLFNFKIVKGSIEYLKLSNYYNDQEIYINKLRNYTIASLLSILCLGISLILNLEPYSTRLIIVLIILKIYLITIIYGLRNIFRELEPSEEG